MSTKVIAIEDSGEDDSSSTSKVRKKRKKKKKKKSLTSSCSQDESSMSESVDPALLNRGFDDSNEDEVGVRRLDDDTQESEDWAERDLRELRTTVSSGAAERRAERRFLFFFFFFFFFFSPSLF